MRDLDKRALDRWIEREPLSVEEDGCECDPEVPCPLVQTDCCDPLRFSCQTVVILDGAGDPDVTVCRAGYGCNAEREDR